MLTVYFMGLDHTSHHEGPGAQYGYLTQVVDLEIGRLSAELERLGLMDGTLVVVVSDHGQIEVIPDDRHSLRMSFPFDCEMGYLFDALGLDVHDLPGEEPACDAVVASNGGMAHVYLRRRNASWSDLPQFEEEVLPVANYSDGFYFGGITTGVHGGLHPQDSLAVTSPGMPGAPQKYVETLRQTAAKTVNERSVFEGRSHASLTDLLSILRILFAW